MTPTAPPPSSRPSRGGGGSEPFVHHGPGWGVDASAWHDQALRHFELYLMRIAAGDGCAAAYEAGKLRELGLTVHYSSVGPSRRP